MELEKPRIEPKNPSPSLRLTSLSAALHPLCTTYLHPPLTSGHRNPTHVGLRTSRKPERICKSRLFPFLNLLFFFVSFLFEQTFVGRGRCGGGCSCFGFSFCLSQVYRHGEDDDDNDDDHYHYINNCYSIHVLSASQSEFHRLIIIKVPIPPISQ